MAVPTLTYNGETAILLDFEPGDFSRALIIDEIPGVVGSIVKDNYSGSANHTATVEISAATIADVRSAWATWYNLKSSTPSSLVISEADSSTTTKPNCIIAPNGITRATPIYPLPGGYGQRISIRFIQTSKT